jgi:crotonobetainyl-CoA:carnitine CoA-transferase CaiB-like acyl-CoA transferase
MLDGLIDCLWIDGAQYLLDGIPLSRGETLYNGAHPGYNIYETRDGKYITLGILEPQFWEALCRLLGQEDFIAHQDAVGEKRQEIFAHFRQAFRTKDRKEWLTILERADIPCGVVNNLEQAFSDPQVRHREMVSEVEHPLLGRLRQIAPAIKLSDTPAEVRTPPPIYGEHTDSILKELGYTKKEIDHLRQQGVIE